MITVALDRSMRHILLSSSFVILTTWQFLDQSLFLEAYSSMVSSKLVIAQYLVVSIG